MMKFNFRRRWMGPKHGAARGVAVFGVPENKNDEFATFTPPCAQLRRWSVEHGLLLDDEPDSLSSLDQHLDSWSSDPSHHEKVNLPVEVGLYLGGVIVNHVDGSQWKKWPNGHPVVQLRTGTELDVTAMASERLIHAGASLDAIFRTSRSQSHSR
jgi:hypothetical protein